MYVFSTHLKLWVATATHREIGMCLCGDSHCHVYTSTEGRKLSSPRHLKMRNELCRLLFSTKQMLVSYLVLVANYW